MTEQITKQNFIRLGIAAFKEHELREIVETFCKLPGIAPQPKHITGALCPYCFGLGKIETVKPPKCACGKPDNVSCYNPDCPRPA